MAFLSNGLPPFERYYDVSARNDNTGQPAGFFAAYILAFVRLTAAKRGYRVGNPQKLRERDMSQRLSSHVVVCGFRATRVCLKRNSPRHLQPGAVFSGLSGSDFPRPIAETYERDAGNQRATFATPPP